MGANKNRTTIGLLVLALLTLAGGAAFAAEGTVNINSADEEELALLPRVGASVAGRIVEYREQNGDFESAADLMMVKGIGERTFELIKPHVSLSGDTTLTEKVRVPKQTKAESDQ